MAPSSTPIEGFRSRVDALIDEIHGAPTASGVERVLVPGEMEWERRRKAESEGIPLPADIAEALGTLGAEAGVATPWR